MIAWEITTWVIRAACVLAMPGCFVLAVAGLWHDIFAEQDNSGEPW